MFCNFTQTLKRQCHKIFWHFFSLIQPIWVPDKQTKMVSLKICFRKDIPEKRDSAQCRTLRSITLCIVGKLKSPKIQNSLTLLNLG